MDCAYFSLGIGSLITAGFSYCDKFKFRISAATFKHEFVLLLLMLSYELGWGIQNVKEY